MLITGAGIEIFRLVTIKSAIALYLKSGGKMKANRAYTSTNMRAAVSKVTGNAYPAGKKGLEEAYNDLTNYLEKIRTSQLSHNPTETSDEALSNATPVAQ